MSNFGLTGLYNVYSTTKSTGLFNTSQDEMMTNDIEHDLLLKKAQTILNTTDVQLSDSILQSMDEGGKLLNDSEEYRRRVLFDEEKQKSVCCV